VKGADERKRARGALGPRRCDADALVYLVTPRGPSCHTGAPSCFFRRLVDDGGKLQPSDEGVTAPTLLARLDAVLLSRKESTAEKSYTKSLYEAGPGGSARSCAKRPTSSRMPWPPRPLRASSARRRMSFFTS